VGWTLLARGQDREVLGALRGWSLDLTLRLNEVGSWSLQIPQEMTPEGWPDTVTGLIMLRDGEVVASGQIDERAFNWSADPDDEDGGPGMFTVHGDTDIGRLAYRICYPDPTLAWTAQPNATLNDAYYRRGPMIGEELMRRMVNDHAGSLALTARRVPGVRLGTATGVGSSISCNERFTPLLEALRKAASASGGLVFDMRDAMDTFIDFTVRAPANKTGSVRFGRELGNVLSLAVKYAEPVTTAALVAAEGEKQNRTLREYTRAGERREEFVDQRQVDGSLTEANAEYEKAGNDALDNGAAQSSIGAVIIDTETVRWGRDYNLGDKVSVLTPYGEVQDLVREVRITVDETGVEEITSVIGSQDLASKDPLAASVRRINDRLSQIERAL